MKLCNELQTSQKKPSSLSCEKDSFKFVSTLLTEVIGRNCQRIFVSAKPGNFIHDHAAEVESTENTYLSIERASVIEREQVTEIVVDGYLTKRNNVSNKFSLFFSMKRQFLVIPKPYAKSGSRQRAIETSSVLDISGMLYNSLFTLSLNGVDNAGCQYPLGTGRGYLIFDEQKGE